MIHEHVCKTFEIMVCYDQLGVGARAVAEYVVRQIQMSEERWRQRVATDVDGLGSELALFSGSLTRGNICVCPQLQKWIAEERRAAWPRRGGRRAKSVRC